MDAMDEHIQMVNELVAILGSSDSEIVDYHSMPKTAVNMQADLDELHTEVKNTIEALSWDIEAEQEKLADVEAKTTTELRNLNEQNNESQKLNSQVSQQISALRSKLEEIQKKSENLARERDRRKEENSQDLVTLRYKVNLYSHVSNIRWDYNAAADDIRGYVANKDKVVPFQMSTKQNSRFFIVNHLWDLMES